MIGRFHAAPLHTQVLLMLAAAPVVVALFGLSLAPRAVEVSLAGEDRHVVLAVEHAVLVAVGLAVACAAAAAVSAAVLLRGSLRTVVERMHGATEAIADGELRHRIASQRRDELGRLADGIDTMAARLERLEESRRRMLACVSHELRTPLTIVRGHAFTLGRDETDPVRRARFDLVDEEAARLAALVDDLLDAACLHAGGVRLERSPVDLTEAAHELGERFEIAASERDVRLRVTAARRRAVVHADRARVAQVLGNLAANAIRHATPGSAIHVDVGWNEGDHVAHVDVSNTGPAIDAHVVHRIFEPFEQHGGSAGRVGLGLSIAHDICAAHGGRLTLADPGTGPGGRPVRFRVELPVGSGVRCPA